PTPDSSPLSLHDALPIWRLTAPGVACFAALLVALSGSVLWTTAPLTSDGIGAALTVATALAAVVYWASPSTRRALLIGVLAGARSEEHTSELQSQSNLVC